MGGKTSALACAVGCVLLLASPVSAQVALLDGFGGTAGFGTECLGPNDDGSSREIDLSSIFPTGLQFFDRTHTSMFVNTNGNISFSEGLAAFTPEAFPIANQPMIAPYWADVDTRPTRMDCGGLPDGSGRPEYTYAGDCADPAQNGVWWHLDTAGRRVLVTWDRVGYYRCNETDRMSFQLVLTAVDGATCGGGGDFDVEFRFNTCEWTTGDASGGMNGDPVDPATCVRAGPGPRLCPIGRLPCEGRTNLCYPIPAQAGFDAGNVMDFVEIMGSRTAEIGTTLCTMSNVDTPGVWRFSIRSGVVECPDAGDACDTGLMGACGTGRTQCVGGGTECRPEVPPSGERCDAVDNDCDGTIDEGELCAATEVCDRGVCVGTCFEGGCGPGQVCTAGGDCVDAGCEDVTCPEGERCIAGACVAACEGVTCPSPLECRAGRCVDLCAGAVCDECTVCDSGDCVPSCEHADCPAGQTCQPDGHCVENACADVDCMPGFVCLAGSCVDACDGASCPEGEMCAAGACVAAEGPVVDAGVMPGVDAAVPPGTDGGPPVGMDGSVAVDAGPGGSPDDSGCGCRAVGPSSGGGGVFMLALGLLGLRRRKR